MFLASFLSQDPCAPTQDPTKKCSFIHHDHALLITLGALFQTQHPLFPLSCQERVPIWGFKNKATT